LFVDFFISLYSVVNVLFITFLFCPLFSWTRIIIP